MWKCRRKEGNGGRRGEEVGGSWGRNDYCQALRRRGGELLGRLRLGDAGGCGGLLGLGLGWL